MAGSFQNEIPAARINLKLDVGKGDAKKKTELPLKMLVLGDFSLKNKDERVAEREKISINKNNFEQVMESLDLNVKYNVDNKLTGEGELGVDLDEWLLVRLKPIQTKPLVDAHLSLCRRFPRGSHHQVDVTAHNKVIREHPGIVASCQRGNGKFLNSPSFTLLQATRCTHGHHGHVRCHRHWGGPRGKRDRLLSRQGRIQRPLGREG